MHLSRPRAARVLATGALLTATLTAAGNATVQAAPSATEARRVPASVASPMAVDALGRPAPVRARPGAAAVVTQAPDAPTGIAPTLIAAPGTAGTESVIGADNRTRVTATTTRPNSAIVHITRNGGAHCTGWLVSKDTLVTAGHCLYDVGTQQWYSGLSFTPGRNASTAPYGSATATRRVIDNAYAASGDTRQDWGIVKLSSPLGTSTGWFALKSQTGGYEGTSATVRGYPGDKAFGTLWTMTGTVAQSTPNGVCYSMDTFGGQSGSPVFNSSNQAIAIHTMGVANHGQNGCASSYNAGTRITQSLNDAIKAEIG